ncbi:MAG TPA: hypothetical protein VF658_15265 [Pyrinomonadaceae bacterium]
MKLIEIYQTIKAYTPAPNGRNRRTNNSDAIKLRPTFTRIERKPVAEMQDGGQKGRKDDSAATHLQ